ncbi:MAG TPA: 6-bladed beta-propeller [Verrucomicrobiae bacterium]|nr:6-bladed beta-propeller [Verrucomicrobiae bacterium]
MNWLLLKNSLLVSGMATLLACGLGLAAALWLAGLPRAWRNLFLGLAILALALPPFLVTNSWLHFLGHAGVWRRWLPFDIFSLGGAVWILALLLWPIPLLVVLSAWQRLEPGQFESDSAVRGWALLRVLLLPSAATALGQGAVLVFVLALNNFAVPAILQLKVFPAEVWVRFNTTFDTAGAFALSWPMVVAPMLVLLWLARRGIPWPHVEATVQPRLFRQQLGPRWGWTCGGATVLLCFLAAVLPVLQLVLVKRTWTELGGALEASQSAIWNSCWLAAVAATIVLALALLPTFRHGARTLVRSNVRMAASSRFAGALSDWTLLRTKVRAPLTIYDLFGAALWFPFLIPGVLLGIALIAVFNRPSTALLYQSLGIVVLAFVIRYLALGWHTVAHASRTIDPALLDVARIEGASRWQTLRHVYWPQLGPQAGAAWYIVFLLCLWDVESMLLVVPPGGETLALRIFNLLHYGHNAQVNALCLTLLALALLPLACWIGIRIGRNAASNVARRLPGKQRLVLGSPMLLAALVALSLSGCGRSNQGLHSRIFDHIKIFGTRGVGVGQLNKPRSVAVDLHDNLYVVDMTGRVQKFAPDGRVLLSWQMPQTDLGKPKGMGRDRQGNIIVVEPHYQRLNHFSPEGKLLFQWGQKGTNEGKFIMPRAVAVNSHNIIFVSEYGVVERVQRFKLLRIGLPGAPTSGPPVEFIDSFGRPGTGPGEFNRAEGLCVDAQDRLYVADSCNHRIQIFSSDGKFLRTYGHAGKGLGEFSYPYDICVDSAGRQYVAEFGNSRLQVFDAQDHPLEIIGRPGLAPGQFGNPWSLALDSAGDLFVADSQNHRVQELLRPNAAARTQPEDRNTLAGTMARWSADIPVRSNVLGTESPLNPSRVGLWNLLRTGMSARRPFLLAP